RERRRARDAVAGSVSCAGVPAGSGRSGGAVPERGLGVGAGVPDPVSSGPALAEGQREEGCPPSAGGLTGTRATPSPVGRGSKVVTKGAASASVSSRLGSSGTGRAGASGAAAGGAPGTGACGPDAPWAGRSGARCSGVRPSWPGPPRGGTGDGRPEGARPGVG